MNWLTSAMAEKKSSKITSQSSAGSMVEQHLRSLVDAIKISNPKTNFAYTTIYDYFLDNGKIYLSSPLTIDQLDLLKREVKRHKLLYKPKQCFYNAQTIAQSNRHCKYVEGFMISSGVPIIIYHAWNSIDEKVIDFTMAHANSGKPILGEIPNGWEYFGTEFPSPMISALWARTGQSLPLVDNYQEGFPLLKKRTRKNIDKADKSDEPEKTETEITNPITNDQNDQNDFEIIR